MFDDGDVEVGTADGRWFERKHRFKDRRGELKNVSVNIEEHPVATSKRYIRLEFVVERC